MESLTNRSEYSDVLPLTAKFILENAQVSWAEIIWAHEMGLIGWRTLKDLAQAALESTPNDVNVLRLASLTKEYASDADKIAQSIAAYGPQLNKATARKKWLYLLLKRLYEDRAMVSDPLGLVEHIYADFDYPEELESFVRYMPTTELVSTPEEGAAKMYQKWRMYLEKCAAQFGAQVNHP